MLCSVSRAICLCTLLVALMTAQIDAGIIINGNVSDWGITVADNDGSNFSGFSPSGATALGSAEEDQDDDADDSGYLGPNRGGQNYDVEFLGVAHDNTDLFIVIVTGQRPDNGKKRFSPGDIIINSTLATYGVEVGGGQGNSSGSASAITEGANGSTYKLFDSGFTDSHTALTSGQLAGSLTRNGDWIQDPIPIQTDTQLDGGGTNLGLVDFYYTLDSFTDDHAVIEVAIPLLKFGTESVTSVKWAPSCGNDYLEVSWELPNSPPPVPEPSSFILAGMGILGLTGYSRRRKSRRA